VEDSTDTAAPLATGQLLAAERERQGLSRVEMAQRLHMSPLQVEALETGQFSRLPKGPFLRGFVRNYAKALGLDGEALVAKLAQDRPAESAPRIVVPSQNIRFDPLGERLSNPYVKAAGIAAVAIALGFAAMYWWLFIRPTPPAAHKPAPATTSSSTPAPVPAPAPTASAPAVPMPQPAPPAMPPPPKSEPAVPPKAQASPAATPVKGDAVLQFRFRGDSWVEVRDARDRIVFQQLNAAGTETSVTARAPLKVIVGNASEVSMRYNDRDFPLEPHTKVAVARFTLE
jgi:cytoskeleton protein RodZ